MRRREFLAMLGGAAAAMSPAAHAQPPLRQPLIAVLSPLSASAAARNIGALRAGLRDLGDIEGKNIRIEVRYADGEPDRLAPLIAELIALNPDVILAGSQGGALAAYNATQTIPIVVAGLLADPVKLGLVKSIARPGGNVTGNWLFADEDALVGKRLELLKLMMPDLSKVGAVLNPGDATDIPMLPLMTRSASALGLDLRVYEVRDASEIDSTFKSIVRDRMGALFVSQSPLFNSHRTEIAELAARARVPAMYGFRLFVDAGGLMSYGPNLPETYRRSATIVDKILKGSTPADIPVELSTRFELVVNLKAAKALNLAITNSFLQLADEVIE